MINPSYSRSVELPFGDAVARVTPTLNESGRGILTTIDVQPTLKAKLGADFEAYTISGACHPPRAFEVLFRQEEIGLLLPCNDIVAENDDGSLRVSAVNAEELFRVPGDPSLKEVAVDVNRRLKEAVDNV
ncbi:MAG: DUF302 domain-containing protein [Candidatus Marinimicrobia bacterium]|nr:DUF302 domain-containing protein [Candidatus Neomarinimicrobiota bacterium]